MTEYEIEPVPGLPGLLPPGERILWQGGPDRAALARTAFHTRAVTLYFALLAAIALGVALTHAGEGPAAFTGLAATAACGIVGVGLLHMLAWATARGAVYTLTDRRIVLRVGIAVPKCINLPLALIGTAGLRVHADGTGDIPLALTGRQQLGWLALWPHARPWRLATPEPMLRAVPDAVRVATLVSTACAAVQPGGRAAAPSRNIAPAPVLAGAVAA